MDKICTKTMGYTFKVVTLISVNTQVGFKILCGAIVDFLIPFSYRYKCEIPVILTIMGFIR